VLYEARGTNDGYDDGRDALIAAMFEAALKDFPQTGVKPRHACVRVSGR
jgi:hypothetical protein